MLRHCVTHSKCFESFNFYQRCLKFLHNNMESCHNAANLSYTNFDPLTGCDRNLSPVIFLHGLAECRESWKHITQLVANKTKRKVVALDLSNHGDSEWTEIFSIKGETENLIQFMNTINIQKAVLVGYSAGSLISLLTALTAPERIDGLILEDMCFQSVTKTNCEFSIDYINMLDEAVSHTLPTMNKDEVNNTVMHFMNRTINELVNQDEVEEYPIAVKRNCSGYYIVKHNSKAIINSLKNPDKVLSIPNCQYNGPVFFIYGELSPAKVGKYEKDIKNNFPTAKLYELKNASHFMHHTYPNEILNFILKSLEEINQFHMQVRLITCKRK